MWTFAAESRKVAIDQTGIVLRKSLVGETERCFIPRLRVGQDHISGGGQTPDKLLSFRSCGISDNAAFATVPDVEPRDAPSPVSVRRLDFNDSRPLFGE